MFSPHMDSAEESSVFSPHMDSAEESSVFSPHMDSVEESSVFSPHMDSVEESSVFIPHMDSVEESSVFSPHMDSIEESSVLSPNSLDEEENVTGLETSENLQYCEKEEHTQSCERKEEEGMKEEEEEERVKKMREEERERKRRDVLERMKRLSLSSSEADEPFSPLSPNLMISERTESLNRSVKKSNSAKKTQPLMTISKIDSRLEQYNHAIELSGQEASDTKLLMDLPTSPEPLAARKNLFEVGEAWNQNQKVISSKDTEGLNVGVADLITHWVKGSPDVHSKSPASKPTPSEVKPGDVKHKKSLWETLEMSSAEKPGGKTSLGKKFKFVETGHGKYEKVLAGDSDNINP